VRNAKSLPYHRRLAETRTRAFLVDLLTVVPRPLLRTPPLLESHLVMIAASALWEDSRIFERFSSPSVTEASPRPGPPPSHTGRGIPGFPTFSMKKASERAAIPPLQSPPGPLRLQVGKRAVLICFTDALRASEERRSPSPAFRHHAREPILPVSSLRVRSKCCSCCSGLETKASLQRCPSANRPRNTRAGQRFCFQHVFLRNSTAGEVREYHCLISKAVMTPLFVKNLRSFAAPQSGPGKPLHLRQPCVVLWQLGQKTSI